MWTLLWLSGTNVDLSEQLLSLLECNCLGPLQFLESGVQGGEVELEPGLAVCSSQAIRPALPRALGLGFLLGKVMVCGL